ncbi:uncharacterized protein K444DRAFT_704532 [Hyaloscypha bicolor E]|uniref:Uncharacterized protein n=1 Tax=Hyaloscypha bicolor E TaxID=1095630 RepID=A0A2J6SQE3_9HELO|nr:uncharacterized protein K444DRAFT_704532 [Hyaloscypha bicolor E]PMD52982.1 hypothetical protein K444DRAFT_704532 [Hyaloscypha bicolor E]
MCTDPSSPAQFDHSLFLGCGDMKGAYRDGVEMLVQAKPSIVFSPKFSRTLVRNGIVVPSRNLWPFHKVEREGSPSAGESESSILSSSTCSSEISQWTEIKDPFARERGDTHTSDIDSADFSRTPSLLTLYTDSTVEFNGSSFEGSHSSDLVPILSPCVRLSFSPARFRPRGRFYNPRFDPQHPLFEPHLLLPGPAAARSLPPVLDQDDNSLLKPDLDSTLDSNPYSSYPVPGEWPDVDSGPEPASGPVGWLKAITSPTIALLGAAVVTGLCAAQFLPWALNNALPSRGVGRQYPAKAWGSQQSKRQLQLADERRESIGVSLGISTLE